MGTTPRPMNEQLAENTNVVVMTTEEFEARIRQEKADAFNEGVAAVHYDPDYRDFLSDPANPYLPTPKKDSSPIVFQPFPWSPKP